MDSENDKKRLDLAVDRLSSLPDDLIHKILSFNDTIDAIRTSSLSSRWRYIWTTMPCLDFSTAGFSTLPKFSKFVKHVLSLRDNQREVSSLKLSFRGKASQVVKKILEYAYAHNVQRLNISCLAETYMEFPLNLFSSESLKQLTLKKVNCIKFTSMCELPALTTLHLGPIRLSPENIDNFSGLISMCVNLKNLTLRDFNIIGSPNMDFSICHSQLSNLTIDPVPQSVSLLSVVAPQLNNLIIRESANRIVISAPDLGYLILHCYKYLDFSADDLHSLEKADICINRPYMEDPQKIVGLLQCLHSVKFLTLNLEILELLSKSVELISHQPSPFANLKRLKIYPKLVYECELPKEMRNVSTEVKNYLLDNSPGATFTLVSREGLQMNLGLTLKSLTATVPYGPKAHMDCLRLLSSVVEWGSVIRRLGTDKNTASAKKGMAELQVLLEQEKADIETNRAHIEQGNAPMESHNAKMDEEQNVQVEGNMAHISSCWKGLSKQIAQGEAKTDDIVSRLHRIKKLLTKLPASNRAELLLLFSSCVQRLKLSEIITDCMKIQLDENQIRLSVGFHEFVTTLQSSS
ncbi:F-box domain containing protein [Tanacetum coccineum]